MIKKLLQYTLGHENGQAAKPGGSFKIVDGELIVIEKSDPALQDNVGDPSGKKKERGDPDTPVVSKNPDAETSGQSGKQKKPQNVPETPIDDLDVIPLDHIKLTQARAGLML